MLNFLHRLQFISIDRPSNRPRVDTKWVLTVFFPHRRLLFYIFMSKFKSSTYPYCLVFHFLIAALNFSIIFGFNLKEIELERLHWIESDMLCFFGSLHIINLFKSEREKKILRIDRRLLWYRNEMSQNKECLCNSSLAYKLTKHIERNEVMCAFLFEIEIDDGTCLVSLDISYHCWSLK